MHHFTSQQYSSSLILASISSLLRYCCSEAVSHHPSTLRHSSSALHSQSFSPQCLHSREKWSWKTSKSLWSKCLSSAGRNSVVGRSSAAASKCPTPRTWRNAWLRISCTIARTTWSSRRLFSSCDCFSRRCSSCVYFAALLHPRLPLSWSRIPSRLVILILTVKSD